MTEEQARKRVKELKEFYGHLTSYISVNAFLFVLNMLVTPGMWWFIFPLLGWGIGMVSHTVKVFGFFGLGGQDWEEQKVREMMGQSQSAEELARLSQRIENLATIVGDKDWEAIEPDVVSAKQSLQEDSARSIAKQSESKVDPDRLTRLLENLEAIVTSSDFDKIETARGSGQKRQSGSTDAPN